MRPRLSIPLTTLVLLVLIEAHRRLLGSVILNAGAALAAPARPLALLAALLPIALLALAAVSFPPAWDRRRLVAAAAAAAALARLGAAIPQSQVAGIAAALAMAAAAVYLGAGVGLLPRRTVAGGAALAFALDVLARWSLDPFAVGSRPVRLGLPLVEATVLLALAAAVPGTRVLPLDGLERRAGGLRLRGALALGAILFLEASALGAPAAAAHRGDLTRDLLAPALALVALGAAVWLMAGGGPARLYRPRLVLMGGLAGAAAALVGPLKGAPAALLLVAGHLCALLLLGRALAPASGRRGSRNGAVMLAMLLALDGALALATAAPPELAPGAAPRVGALAALVLIAALSLIPRPAPAPPLLSRLVARLALAIAVAGGLALALAAARPAAAPHNAPPPSPPTSFPTSTATPTSTGR